MRPNQLIVRLKQIDFLKGGKALDVGAGAGIDSLFLNENNYQVTAVDVNTEKLKEGGVLAFSFFGLEDEWSDKERLLNLLKVH